jgi:lysine 2,3-aminomutase
MLNRLTQLKDFQSKLTLTQEEVHGIRLSEHKLAVAITPYFFNLIDPNDPEDLIRYQMIPHEEEMQIAPEESYYPAVILFF